MSSCLILQKNNLVVMGSDTALSCYQKDEFFRISNYQKKIFHILNSLIFCSGDILFVNKVIAFIEDLKFIDINKISDFLKNITFPKNKKIFNIELAICLLEDNNIRIFQLSEYNNFDIVEHIVDNKNIKVISAGIDTQKSNDLAIQELEKDRNILRIFKKVFEELSSEKIGGNLEIWKIDNSIEKIYDEKIPENNIKYLNSQLLAHSIVGDVIVGKLLAGNELILTNENNTFTLNGSGATLTNAAFTIQTDKNRILLNPDDGIAIQKYTSGSYKNQFYVDNNGNVIFAGTLSAASGTFYGTLQVVNGNLGGWTITAEGFKDNLGNYIYSNGKVHLGMLTIDGNSAWFDGNVYADNINGYIQGNQLQNINADTIVAGTIRGINIYGSVIRWPGAQMSGGDFGTAEIIADNRLKLSAGTENPASLVLTDGIINLNSTNVNIGSTLGCQTDIYGDLAIDGYDGFTTHIISSGIDLEFYHGILINGYSSATIPTTTPTPPPSPSGSTCPDSANGPYTLSKGYGVVLDSGSASTNTTIFDYSCWIRESGASNVSTVLVGGKFETWNGSQWAEQQPDAGLGCNAINGSLSVCEGILSTNYTNSYWNWYFRFYPSVDSEITGFQFYVPLTGYTPPSSSPIGIWTGIVGDANDRFKDTNGNDVSLTSGSQYIMQSFGGPWKRWVTSGDAYNFCINNNWAKMYVDCYSGLDEGGTFQTCDHYGTISSTVNVDGKHAKITLTAVNETCGCHVNHGVGNDTIYSFGTSDPFKIYLWEYTSGREWRWTIEQVAVYNVCQL